MKRNRKTSAKDKMGFCYFIWMFLFGFFAVSGNVFLASLAAVMTIWCLN